VSAGQRGEVSQSRSMALRVNIIILLSLVVLVGGPDDVLQLGVEATLDSALRPAGQRLL
jgi:hypothetical protein